MAIKAIIETGREIPEPRIMELAVGERDEFGKPFTLIRLMAIPLDHRGVGARFHVCGFQDAFIHVLDSGIKIKYGPEGKGDVMFEKNDLGKLVGTLAKTQWNMETLAAEAVSAKTMGEKWRIMDADIADEVRTLMKKVDSVPSAQKPVAPEDKLLKELEMLKKNEALKQGEKLADEPEPFLGARKLEEELMKVNYNKLLERAKATGGWNEKLQKREDLVKTVIAYEGAKFKKEELAVE